ncbi:RHS repeat-associated core domain-containing protein [Aeromicrobium sp. HA]|uniref:RHS repeat-associated core domain-containing protein n=1 Tax=Aeromicrobium sp. HA TaxID=3009077 RepID=UPI0022B03825|nr:RHS repeat-associated core domain-containing protein [Aeromicrobium sp. HA]
MHLTWSGLLFPRRWWALVAALAVSALIVTAIPGPVSAEEKPTAETEQDDVAPKAVDSDGDGVPDRPDAVSAGATARVIDESVEDLSQRTETSKTFVNPDGTSTLETSAGIQRLQGKDGDWQDVDLDLVEGADGSYAPKVAPSDVTIGGGGSKLAATVNLDEDQALSVTWPERLPEPDIDGGVATYKLSETTDLLVIATKTGVAAHIRLNEPPAEDDPALTMGLKTENLSLDTTAKGELEVTDSNDKKVATTAPMKAWDAQVDAGGDPINVVAVTPTLDEVSSSGDVARSELTLEPEAGFLQDPETVYPVIVDPDISRVTLTSDTMVRNGITDPKGTDARLWVGRLQEATSTDQWLTYVKWNNSQLAGKTILSASAKLWQYMSTACGRQMNARALSADLVAGTVFSNRPGVISTYGSSTTDGPCLSTGGWVTTNLKNMAQAWASGSTPNYGVQFSVPSEYASNYNFSRRFCSANESAAVSYCNTAAKNPVLSVTYNSPPTSVTVPTPGAYRTVGSTMYVPTSTPTFSATGNDQNSNVTLTFQTHTSTAGTNNTLVGSCAVSVASGASGSCQPDGTLTSGGTYYARVQAKDAQGLTLWSGWRSFVVDTAKPTITAISCSNGYAMDEWYETPPAGATNCTYTTTGAYDVAFKITTSTSSTATQKTVLVTGGDAATGSISVPTVGTVSVRAIAYSRAGTTSNESLAGFGVGSGAIILPSDGDRSTSWFPISATGPTHATSAKVQWRRAPATANPLAEWANATEVKTATGGSWDGNLSSTGSAGMSTPEGLVWDASTELNQTDGALIEIRVVFEGPATTDVSELRRATVVPHAFGGTFPTADLGPGQVSLFTGELQHSASDVDVAGMSLGRSHLSMAGTYSGGPTGVFGPGWTSDIGGGEAGQAGFTVTDRTGVDGSITLVDSQGASYVYRHDSGTRGSLATGSYVPVGENATDNDRLTLTPASGAATFRLTLTQEDGTITRWATSKTVGSWTEAAPAVFWVEQVEGPEDNSTTTYASDADGRTTWIFSPTPAGVTCNATTREAGCRALELEYTGAGTGTRLAKVWAHLWNPDKTGGADMDRVAVAEYAYDAGKLVEAWDPRISPALKTTYTYSGPANRPQLATITESGLKPWEITYDADGKVEEVTRERPSGSYAAWTIDYSIGLNQANDGFPDLSPPATSGWGQSDPAGQPADGAAVYSPGIPSGLNTAERNEYADLSYFTTNGRVTNTAEYGAGRWQITTTGYDELGNITSELSPAARLKVLDQGPETASMYSTLMVYNTAKEAANGEAAIAAGVRLEQIYGPMHEVMTDSGDVMIGRALAETDYDDEVPAALRPGRPAEINEGGFNLAVRKRISTTTDPAPSASPTTIDTRTTRYEYAPVVDGDGSGWELFTPTKTITGVGTSAQSTTVTRLDSQGAVFQTRTPQGVADNDQARWTNTVLYTADNSATRAECRHKPAWIDLVCWTGPAMQPTGGDIPETVITKYDLWLSPVRIAEVVGGAERRVTTEEFDSAGRSVQTSVSTPGVADTDVPNTSFEYDDVTGLLVSISNGTHDGVSNYDSWARVTTQSDGYGNIAATTYDSAGRVSTFNDGKGTYTYHYDGTDAQAAKERRGLVTRLETGVTGVEQTGAYDSEGNLTLQVTDSVTSEWTYDLNGAARNLVHDLGDGGQLGFSQITNTTGQIRQDKQILSTKTYSYDGRNRLTKVEDVVTADVGGTPTHQCNTRTYGFSVESNRTSLTSYDPGTGGSCQDATAASLTNRSYDSADRSTLSGYTYDQLGRSLTVPGADLSTGVDLTVGYHANDMVRSISTTGETQTYDLDPAGRVRQITTAVAALDIAQISNHYADKSDSPAWSTFKTREDGSTSWEESWTRYVAGLGSGLHLTTNDAGVTQAQLGNLDGDVVGGWDLTGGNAGTLMSYGETTEYGLPQTVKASGRYGWLGKSQRDTTIALGDLTLMGARLYNPFTGRFLTRDPIAGGNDNAYIYPADPINWFDLTGMYKTSFKWYTYSKCKYSRNGNRWCMTVPIGFYYSIKWNKSETKKARNVGTAMGMYNSALDYIIKRITRNDPILKNASSSLKKTLFRSLGFGVAAMISLAANIAHYRKRCVMLEVHTGFPSVRQVKC